MFSKKRNQLHQITHTELKLMFLPDVAHFRQVVSAQKRDIMAAQEETLSILGTLEAAYPGLENLGVRVKGQRSAIGSRG